MERSAVVALVIVALWFGAAVVLLAALALWVRFEDWRAGRACGPLPEETFRSDRFRVREEGKP